MHNGMGRVQSFQYYPKGAWSEFHFFHDEDLNFEFLGFGEGMRSNDCPSS